MPRWLSTEERAAWLALTRLLVRLPAALEAQLERDAGLNQFEYLVLAMLSERADRTLRMSQLAAITHASLSRLSHVVKRLETQGFLYREPDPEDGRYINAVLTEDGMEKVVATAPGHVETVHDLVIDALTPGQLRDFHKHLDRILARVDPDGMIALD
jgi:DNA-binding MarR family transcriptional regulator